MIDVVVLSLHLHAFHWYPITLLQGLKELADSLPQGNSNRYLTDGIAEDSPDKLKDPPRSILMRYSACSNFPFHSFLCMWVWWGKVYVARTLKCGWTGVRPPPKIFLFWRFLHAPDSISKRVWATYGKGILVKCSFLLTAQLHVQNFSFCFNCVVEVIT